MSLVFMLTLSKLFFSFYSYDSAFSQPTAPSNGHGDPELQRFIETVQQQAEFQSHVNHLTSICWEKCASGYPSAKLDGKKATCLENCAERYIDVSMLLRNRFQTMLSKLQHQ